MLVHDILNQSAHAFPNQPAVWFAGAWTTYAELDAGADAIAVFLLELGICPGDRVALLLDNSIDYIMALFGTLRAGAVEVSLNTELRSDDLKLLLLDCEAKVLFAGEKYVRHWSPILFVLVGLRHVIVDWDDDARLSVPSHTNVYTLRNLLQANLHLDPSPRRRESDLASIVYTSGVTGRPKGVMLSHRNLVSNTASIVAYLKLSCRDRMMVVLPFYYIYGRSLLYTHFFSGGSLVIENRFAFPMTVLNAMQELEVTAFAGVPSTYAILLNKTDLKRRRFPHLRLLTQAGGGMAPALQKEVAEIFKPAQLYVMYGCTEAAPRLTYLEPAMLDAKSGSIGKAIPNVEVVVLDEDGNPLPPGQPGEIAARGPNVMLGYWKDPETTSRVLRHGYYYTGDLGYADDEGYLFLTGRARDFIKAGGKRVSGKEVEDAVSEHPDVLESAVIGVPDDMLGEAIKAFVVARRPALTENSIKEHLKRRLPPFKQPKWIEIVDQLPKNQAGKILKALLRERL